MTANFWRGFASVLDLFPRRKQAKRGRQFESLLKDRAVRRDWDKIGDDFRKVLRPQTQTRGKSA